MTDTFTLLDGGMGTMLLEAGLPAGTSPEVWNLTEPEKVTAVHRAYYEAGSRVLYANTFGANRKKLRGADPREAVAAGIRCARAAGPEAKVALDIGPIGQLLAPLGTLSFDEAYDIFREMVEAGRDAGADLIVIETMSDLAEVRAAVLAARENSELPVWVTMTFEAGGRTFLGCTVPAMGLTLRGLGVDALGFNCSVGPDALLPLIRELRNWTGDLPLILKPNAGLPDVHTGEYKLTAAEFAETMAPAAALGVRYFGGCCGTRPAFIAALGETLTPMEQEPKETRHGVCTARRVLELAEPVLLGNCSEDDDPDDLADTAMECLDEEAELLDLSGIEDAALLAQGVRSIQETVDLPMLFGDGDPAALEAGLRAFQGKALVKLGGEASEEVLSLCRKYGAALVCETRRDLPGIPAGDIYLLGEAEEEDGLLRVRYER